MDIPISSNSQPNITNNHSNNDGTIKATNSQALNQNQVIQGEVIKTLVNAHGQNMFLLKGTNNQLLWFQSNGDINKGQSIYLKSIDHNTFLILNKNHLSEQAAIERSQIKHIPNQSSLSSLLSNLVHIKQNISQSDMQTYSGLYKEVQQLLSHILSSTDITNSQLIKSWINQSGITLENKLLQIFLGNSIYLGFDFKAQLLRLYEILSIFYSSALQKEGILALFQFLTKLNSRNLQTNYLSKNRGIIFDASNQTKPPLPPPVKGTYFLYAQPYIKPSITQKNINSNSIFTLLKQVGGYLSRIHLFQLTSLTNENSDDTNNRSNYWNMEIPIFNHNQLYIAQLHISNKASKKNPKEKVWQLNLAIDIDPLGPIYSKTLLSNNEISSWFWVDNKKTMNLAQRFSKIFTLGMEQYNLTVNHLSFHVGKPPNLPNKTSLKFIDLYT